MAEAYDKASWTEIAAFGLIAGLIGYILYHSRHQIAQASDALQSAQSPSTRADTIPNVTLAEPAEINVMPTLNSIGLPPLNLPIGAGNTGCSCSVASSDPTIANIVAVTNAALAQMQTAANATYDAIADMGDINPGYQDFVLNYGTL